MRSALFRKYIPLSLAAAALLAASGCTNCGVPKCDLPKCAPAPAECVVIDRTTVVKAEPPAAPARRSPEAPQKAVETAAKAVDETPPAKPAEQAKQPAQPTVLPPIMPEDKAALRPPAAAGCLIPADTPLAPADVASYVESEHFDIPETELAGEPLPPMPTFRGALPVEPPLDTAP